MAYLGVPQSKLENLTTNVEIVNLSASFDGSTQTFNLQDTRGTAVYAITERALLVILGGVTQKPGVDYTVDGQQITFTTAPASNLTISIRKLFGVQRIIGVNDGVVTPVKLSTGAPVWNPSGNVTISGDLNVTGAFNAGGNGLFWEDNERANFGNDNDLKIYHDASDSYIVNEFGNLYIDNYANDNDIKLRTDNGTGQATDYIICDGSAGSVSLHHYGTKKFETTSIGISIDGGIRLDNNGEFALFQDDTNLSFTGSSKISLDFSNDVARIRSSINGTATLRPLAFYTANNEWLRIDTTGSITIGSRSAMSPTADPTRSGARLSIDCHGRNVLNDVTNIAQYGLAFHNDPTTDQANGIGFFNDDGTTCGGYILHQDKGGSNIGDLVFATSSTANTPVEKLRITSGGAVGVGTDDPVARMDVIGEITSPNTPSGYDYRYASNGSGLRIYGTESALDIVGYDNGDHSSSILIRNDNDGFGIVNAPDAEDLKIRSFTATADNFYVHASGNSVSNLKDLISITRAGAIRTAGAVTGANFASAGGIDACCGVYSVAIGGNSGGGSDQNTRTNTNNKEGRIVSAPYTNTEEPISIATVFNRSSENLLYFGGGSSLVNAATKIGFYTAANTTTTGGTERLHITPTGSIGIGTDTPQSKLHIANGDLFINQDTATGGTGECNIFFSEAAANSNGWSMKLSYNGDSYSNENNRLTIAMPTLTVAEYYYDGKIRMGGGSGRPTGHVDIQSDNGLYIKSSTNNPTNGAWIRFSDHETGGFGQYGWIKYKHSDAAVYTGSTDGFIIGGTESNTIVKIDGQFVVNETDAQVFLNAGRGTGHVWKVNSSGTNAQSFELYDSSGSQRAFLYGSQGAADAYKGWTFYTNGTTDRLRIDNNGNVGIGINNPSAKLHVNGAIRTNDLELSNMENPYGGNEVDGTRGHWCIQEGEEDLYIINRITGKRYRMSMTEV